MSTSPSCSALRAGELRTKHLLQGGEGISVSVAGRLTITLVYTQPSTIIIIALDAVGIRNAL